MPHVTHIVETNTIDIIHSIISASYYAQSYSQTLSFE